MNNLTDYPWLIAVFGITVIIMLLLDLGVFNKDSHVVSNKEALVWSLVWIGLAMLFSGIILYSAGVEKFSQFQAAYWIEKALSIDNLFVFILVFGFFKVPAAYQHKVLFWGIAGAIAFRAIFIFTGVRLIEMTFLPPVELMGISLKINILLTLFGIFLIYGGIKSWFATIGDVEPKNLNNSPGAKLISRFFNISTHFNGDRFFTRENGKLVATPLLVVLSVIEFTDLLFAIDSIPAIFAIAPQDSFILYTSNIFAILGMRALYFFLANSLHLFSRLKYGLALILVFIGCKMLLAPLYHIAAVHSLIVVAGILIVSVLASRLYPELPREAAFEAKNVN